MMQFFKIEKRLIIKGIVIQLLYLQDTTVLITNFQLKRKMLPYKTIKYKILS